MRAPIQVELTMPQLRFVRELVAESESIGDCNLHGCKLQFTDYEGAAVFQRKLLGIPAPKTRLYITQDAIYRKISAAIVETVRRRQVAEEMA